MIEELIYASLVLIAWTILYKETPAYRALENTYIGLFLAVTFYGGVNIINQRVLTPIFVEGKIMTGATVALICGILLYTRFFKGIAYISRMPLALMAGIGTAITVAGTVGTMIIKQLYVGPFLGVDPWTGFNNLITVVATVTTLLYFLYTFRPTSGLKSVSKVGRFFMMIGFACTFAAYVWGAGTTITGFSFYLTTYPGYYASILAVIIFSAYLIYERQKS